jgi:hypothetical protein
MIIKDDDLGRMGNLRPWHNWRCTPDVCWKELGRIWIRTYWLGISGLPSDFFMFQPHLPTSSSREVDGRRTGSRIRKFLSHALALTILITSFLFGIFNINNPKCDMGSEILGITNIKNRSVTYFPCKAIDMLISPSCPSGLISIPLFPKN